MKAGQAGRTLARGTWFSFEAWARWLSGASHKDRSGVVRLAVVVVRLVLSLLAALFYAGTLTYAPHLIYAAPVVWAVTAWHMSDWSSPPPPPSEPLSGDEYAVESTRVREVRQGPGEGITIFPEIEYVTGPAPAEEVNR
ncbi:hypothetical protein ACH4C6_14815 [Streptomyces sp. NPDC017943]|uniref:hypothetical protein n=1 Tax=Streptomyces sp. NPDC017943 TaxID=3365019 RepID=UPI00378C3C9D